MGLSCNRLGKRVRASDAASLAVVKSAWLRGHLSLRACATSVLIEDLHTKRPSGAYRLFGSGGRKLESDLGCHTSPSSTRPWRFVVRGWGKKRR